MQILESYQFKSTLDECSYTAVRGMDVSNITLVIQWRATCNLLALWQRFGCVARNRELRVTGNGASAGSSNVMADNPSNNRSVGDGDQPFVVNCQIDSREGEEWKVAKLTLEMWVKLKGKEKEGVPLFSRMTLVFINMFVDLIRRLNREFDMVVDCITNGAIPDLDGMSKSAVTWRAALADRSSVFSAKVLDIANGPFALSVPRTHRYASSEG
ncbi:hypothetical protein L210DRAFT_3511358 [Boletus edulis BED1]|uniref:Uncharacterized protein n=1 Tax=Boletus edulis BED1 TaxID=1328754 RepID=A0AAD4BBE7_BOLED|nr:hypothetical protein L210DRAFT_3511358 [Boletus edulis BED1]